MGYLPLFVFKPKSCSRSRFPFSHSLALSHSVPIDTLSLSLSSQSLSHTHWIIMRYSQSVNHSHTRSFSLSHTTLLINMLFLTYSQSLSNAPSWSLSENLNRPFSYPKICNSHSSHHFSFHLFLSVAYILILSLALSHPTARTDVERARFFDRQINERNREEHFHLHLRN